MAYTQNMALAEFENPDPSTVAILRNNTGSFTPPLEGPIADS